MSLDCSSLNFYLVSYTTCYSIYNKLYSVYLYQLSILLVYLWMLLNNYQLTKMLLVRDHWQITFITFNKFCLLIEKKSTSLFLIENIQLDGVPTKIKLKIHTHLYFKYKVTYFLKEFTTNKCFVSYCFTLAFQQISFFTNF